MQKVDTEKKNIQYFIWNVFLGLHIVHILDVARELHQLLR